VDQQFIILTSNFLGMELQIYMTDREDGVPHIISPSTQTMNEQPLTVIFGEFLIYKLQITL